MAGAGVGSAGAGVVLLESEDVASEPLAAGVSAGAVSFSSVVALSAAIFSEDVAEIHLLHAPCRCK